MLRTRLLITYLGLVLVFTLANWFVLVPAVRRVELDSQRDRLAATAESVDAFTGGARGLESRASLQARVGELGRVAQCRITILTADGTVIADTERDPSLLENHANRPEIQEARAGAPGWSLRHSGSVGDDLLYVAVVSRTGDGWVRAAARADGVARKVDMLDRLFAGGLGAELILALVLGYFVASRLTRRVDAQLAIADRIADGDFSARIDATGSDEMARLGRAMNRMAERLRTQIDDLHAGSRELSSVLDAVADAIIAVKPDDSITHLNTEAARLFDADRRAVGRPFWEVVRDASVPDLVAQVRRDMRAIEGSLSLSHPPPSRDLEIRLTPIRGADGGYAGTVMSFRDVTRLHKLEGIRRDFVANVSHEMKTPLTSIQGYVETLQAGAIGDAEVAQEFLAKIERNARNLGHLVTDLLVLSRVEAGGIQVDAEPFPVAAVIGEAGAVCGDKAREKGLHVRVDVPPREWLVRGDHDLLVRALVNLLENAIHYTKPGGSISVDCALAAGRVEISVKDTGIGIPALELERVFERFYRVDKARSRALGGTGLGLAIVKHVAERHGGSIRVVSQEAVGSTFTLSLPVATTAAA